jgi:hypothetical protein
VSGFKKTISIVLLLLFLNFENAGAVNLMPRDEYNFWISTADDDQPPILRSCSPEPNADNVACSSNIKACIFDTQSAIDSTSINMNVNGMQIINNGSIMTYQDVNGNIQYYQVEIIAKTENEYVLMYDPGDNFNYEQTVSVAISAADEKGNRLDHSNYSFKVQGFLISSISSFSTTAPINIISGVKTLDQGFLQDNSMIATSGDGKNVFIAWEQRNNLGAWDIYCARSNDFGQSFGNPVRVNPEAAGIEQRFPSIALDSENNVYISWQQKTLSGDWDIYIAKMEKDQNAFSQSYRIYNDLNSTDQISPAIVIGPALRSDWRSWTKEPETVYVVWIEDNGNSSQVRYTRSTSSYSDSWNVFVNNSIRIDQDRWPQKCRDPIIKLDDSGRIFTAWRAEDSNGISSIYFDRANKTTTDGAESFQADITVDNGNSAANSPDLEVSSDGNNVYLLFKELNGSGANLKFSYYRYTDGAYRLNTSKMVNSGTLNNIDLGNYELCLDRSGRVSAVWSEVHNGNRVINIAGAEYSGYDFSEFALIATSGYQKNPSLAMDSLGGHYYVGWTDDSNGFDGVYFCRNTYIVTDQITSQKINNDVDSTVTVLNGSISRTSITIPADAIDVPITITIAEAVGAPDASNGITRLSRVVDFGPGQTIFNFPSKITLPYENNNGLDEQCLNIFYYNIGNLKWELVPGSIVDALNKTVSADINHFSMYMVAEGVPTLSNSETSSGSGGGGGCFIATAAFGTEMDQNLYILRKFRDKCLLKNEIGTKFVQIYYKYSPPLADKIRENDDLRKLARICLKPLILLSRGICR